VDPRPGRTGVEKLATNGIRSPDGPARSESVFRPIKLFDSEFQYFSSQNGPHGSGTLSSTVDKS
jgi:hypothetical protein